MSGEEDRASRGRQARNDMVIKYSPSSLAADFITLVQAYLVEQTAANGVRQEL